MILNEKQIAKIILQLRQRNGLLSGHLLEEMTDHFCCMVEKNMISGLSFDESFDDVKKSFHPDETKKMVKSVRKFEFHQRLKRKARSISAVAATFILLLVAVANAQNKPEGPPVKGDAEITSRFGKKRVLADQKIRYHRGVDFKLPVGTPIYATADGVISETQHAETGYGIKIVIDHEENYQTLFGHLSKIAVREGQTVKKGDLIGYSGNSGQSTHPHLHYEVRKSGKTVNPHPYIDGREK